MTCFKKGLKKIRYNEKTNKFANERSWRKFTQFLLDFIENKINRGLNVTQTYIDAYQRPIQTVRQFDIYLTPLKF